MNTIAKITTSPLESSSEVIRKTPGIPPQKFSAVSLQTLRGLADRALAYARAEGVPAPFIQRVDFGGGREGLGIAFSMHDAAQREWVYVRYDSASGAMLYRHRSSGLPAKARFDMVAGLERLTVGPDEASRIARSSERTKDAAWNMASVTVKPGGQLGYSFWHSSDWRNQPAAHVVGRRLVIEQLGPTSA